MLVSVPTSHHAKSPLQSRLIGAWLCAWLVACAACSPTPAAVDDSGAASGGITVTFDKKTTALLTGPVSTSIAVSGSLVLDKGVILKKTGGVVVLLGDKITAPCNVNGANFTCAVDTTGMGKDGKPLVGCNETLSLVATATGTLSGADVSGSASADVEVDNCVPSIKITTDAPSTPGGVPTFVGTTTLHVLVSDGHLDTAHLDVLAPDGNTILTGGQFVMPTGTGTTWKFDYKLDTTRLAATEKLTVAVTAKDKTNDETTTSAEVFSVKAASFLGQANDQFSHTINDFVMPTVADAADGFVAFTTDPTPTSGLDQLADVVVAANDGVYIRAGMPKRNDLGQPIDKDGQQLSNDANTHAHSLKFEDLRPEDSLAKYRVLHYGSPAEATAKINANMARVFLRDLDADGDLDIIAVGTITGDGKPRGEVWAILNVPVNIKKSTIGTDGKTVEFTETIRGFKVIDTLVLPAPPSTAEMAKLNDDDFDDLLIGALKTTSETGQDVDFGLMTLVLTPSPTCVTSGDANPGEKPCGDPSVEYAYLKAGKVFSAGIKVAPNMGVTGVVSIATGEFWDGDGVDVCVGSSNRPIVSCYRNVAKDGTLNQAQDAYQFKDGTDTHLILQVDLPVKSGKSGPDLLVASGTGHYLRWLRTNHAGQFTFVEQQNVANRQILHIDVQAMDVGTVGAKGEPYVIAGVAGREVEVIPLDPADTEYVRACFRSWIIGGGSVKVMARDVDGDTVLDLVNASDSGIQIAPGHTKAGKFTGGFVAPTAHHLCASYWPASSRGVQEIVAAKVADFNKDKFKELLVVGKESASDQPGEAGACKTPSGPAAMPVWPIATFMNDAGMLNPEPRQTEFSPYHPINTKNAGLVTDCAKGGPQLFGHVNAAVLADVNGDGLPDLVTVRTSSSYAVGQETSTAKTCQCLFDEQNEVTNSYGEEIPPGDKPDPSKCCNNYYGDDATKSVPLVGFGGGAPMLRASGHVFLSNASGPLGMKATCNALPPSTGGNGVCVTAPAYAFSAGRNPVDVQVTDVDGDKHPDIITAMDNDGTPCFKVVPGYAPYLQARVRVFQNVPQSDPTKALFKPTFISDSADKLSIRDIVSIASCTNPAALGLSTVSYRTMPDQLTAIVTGPWPNPKDGKKDPATIFGLGHAYGQIGILPHLDKFNYVARTSAPMGGPPDAFNAADINGDGIADLLVLSKGGTQLAILTGKLNNDNPKDAAFDTQTALSLVTASFPGAVSAAMGDVNKDGNLDLVLLSKSSQITFMLGTGDGSFIAYDGGSVAADPAGLEISDMDGDGCQDLVVRSKTSVTIIQNEGPSLEECGSALRWAHDAAIAAQ